MIINNTVFWGVMLCSMLQV